MSDDPAMPEVMRDRPATQPVRSRWRGAAMFGLSLLVPCVAVWGVVQLINRADLDDLGIGFFMALSFLILLMFSAVLLFKVGLQLVTPDAEQVLAHDKRDPVVYLRPFDEDTRRIYALPVGKRDGGEEIVNRSSHASHEHLFKHELKQIGPFVAVGRPGDKLAPLGAARFYLADNAWQEKVDALVRSAAAIVLCPETSAGTRWEVTEVARLVDRRRVLIVVPNPRLRPLGYARIQALTQKTLPVPLPADCQDADAFMFDEEGRPQPLFFGALHVFVDQVRRLSQAQSVPT
jgi:hypothetical protein